MLRRVEREDRGMRDVEMVRAAWWAAQGVVLATAFIAGVFLGRWVMSNGEVELVPAQVLDGGAAAGRQDQGKADGQKQKQASPGVGC